MSTVTVLGALAAGSLSFLSPCVFPLVPGYLSFLGGSGADVVEGRGRLLGRALAFALGLGLVFVAMGATATSLGRLLGEHRRVFEVLGGTVVVLFGLHMLGALRIGLLLREARFHRLPMPSGFAGALLVGAAFGFGWSPCVGPLLGGVLTLAAAEETVRQGVFLLSAYALGLAVPFVLAALLFERFVRFSQRVRPFLPWIERASGALLLVFGLLLIANRLHWLAALLPGLESLAL
ncbi:MAG TPA: cytochrome c biogenesis CcdA family protein [Fredinandcohnia sp.]|nr:cytochrome c biogenesis CcdA family protein [Fredinandcohnia sp.]